MDVVVDDFPERVEIRLVREKTASAVQILDRTIVGDSQNKNAATRVQHSNQFIGDF